MDDQDLEAIRRFRDAAEALQLESESLVRGILGDAEVDGLVRWMLSEEVAPYRIRTPGISGQEPVAGALSRLEEGLRALDAPDAGLIEHAMRAAQADGDPVGALLLLAMSPGYSVIPLSLLVPPLDESPVLQELPELRSKVDERGLLDITDVEAAPDALFFGGRAIAYHQLLRRSFTGHVNDALTTELLSLRGKGLAVRVAFDERWIRARSAYVPMIEKEYWWGPPLSDARFDDPGQRQPEMLVHRWPADADHWPPDDPYEQVTIYTKVADGVRTVEIEELIDPVHARQRCEYRLVRYLHAEREIVAKSFRHMDGAVRYYRTNNYERRRNSPWPKSEEDRPEGRRKVFRVDGSITTETWSNITALWFRGNALVLEALASLAPKDDASSQSNSAV
jgi:hypothetical protein